MEQDWRSRPTWMEAWEIGPLCLESGQTGKVLKRTRERGRILLGMKRDMDGLGLGFGNVLRIDSCWFSISQMILRNALGGQERPGLVQKLMEIFEVEQLFCGFAVDPGVVLVFRRKLERALGGRGQKVDDFFVIVPFPILPCGRGDMVMENFPETRGEAGDVRTRFFSDFPSSAGVGALALLGVALGKSPGSMPGVLQQ